MIEMHLVGELSGVAWGRLAGLLRVGLSGG